MTSFIPETTRMATAVDCVAAGPFTADHRWSEAVGFAVDLPKLLAVSSFVERNTLLEILSQQALHFDRVRGW